MNRLLWILQVVFGFYFIAVGVMHFVVPDGLPDLVSWMYDLSSTRHALAGVAEIAGGLGLILPGLTGVRPGLTVWAAGGLIVVMVMAAIWHAGRDEWINIGGNVTTIVVLGFIVFGRIKLVPLEPRSG